MKRLIFFVFVVSCLLLYVGTGFAAKLSTEPSKLMQKKVKSGLLGNPAEPPDPYDNKAVSSEAGRSAHSPSQSNSAEPLDPYDNKADIYKTHKAEGAPSSAASAFGW